MINRHGKYRPVTPPQNELAHNDDGAVTYSTTDLGCAAALFILHHTFVGCTNYKGRVSFHFVGRSSLQQNANKYFSEDGLQVNAAKMADGIRMMKGRLHEIVDNPILDR